MQRLLTTAAILPGFYAAWYISSQHNVAYAKNSSKSSSYSSSWKTSSSSSKSSSSSSSSPKSLSQRSSSHSSKARSVSPKNVRNDGSRRFMRTKHHAKSQQSSKQLTIVSLIGLLGVVSKYFYRYERMRYCLPVLRRILQTAEPIDLSKLSDKFDKKLIYGTGAVRVAPHCGLLTDTMFGVTATNPNSLMLRRHVELFKEPKEDQEDQKGEWFSAQYIEKIHSDMFQKMMAERCILPEQIYIGDYELTSSQIIALQETGLSNETNKSTAEKPTKRLEIDFDIVDEVFQDLCEERDISLRQRSSRVKNAFSSKTEKETTSTTSGGNIDITKEKEGATVEKIDESIRIIRQAEEPKGICKLNDSFEMHPFSSAQTQGKSISYEGEFIFIGEDYSNPQEGDMRISFSEIEPILNATIIAEQNGASFKEHLVSELEGLKLDLKLFSNGKQVNVKLDMINIIQEGKVDKVKLIEDSMKKVKTNSRKISAILASLIFILYASIIDSIGQSLNPLNWFGKNAAARRLQSRQNAVKVNKNAVSISKNNNLSFLSYFFAAPLAGTHIAATSLLALSRTYISLLGGGALAGYLVYIMVRDTRESNQFINQIDEHEEEEIFETSHDDEEEERILSMIDQSDRTSSHKE